MHEGDDDIRWITALLSDTGMRFSEAIGLPKTDIVLDHPHPHLMTQPHPWRRLNTEGSKRIVPLVGSAFWAARRATEALTGEHLFPRYIRNGECLFNSASAASNKWLKHHIPKECSVHSFRHSMRDRLRAIECPSDIIDRIGGWITPGVGQGYGSGYPIAVLHRWMEKLT